MDDLALLCNLHMDGPASRVRLQRAGCESLADVAILTADELGTLLDLSPERADRIVREARWLMRPDSSRALEREDSLRAVSSPPIAGHELLDSGSPVAAPSEWAPPAPAPDRPLESEHEPEPPREPSHRLTPVPSKPRASTNTPLRPGLDPALHRAWCTALAAEGIRTLEALVGAETADLAARLDRSAATVVGLQAAARSHLAGLGRKVDRTP